MSICDPDRAGERAQVRQCLMREERGSATVEYVGLALVVSMLMTAVGAAVDSALGDRLAHAMVEQLVGAIVGGS